MMHPNAQAAVDTAVLCIQDWLDDDESHERMGHNARGASLTETHRYLLWRHWSPYGRVLPWIMLNPSTADAQQDDPTIRRCIDFSKRWGYGGMIVANLFAVRSPSPDAMVRTDDPIGPGNDRVLAAISRPLTMVVCAWGRLGRCGGRGAAVLQQIRHNLAVPMCLGLNGDRSPKHPLYVRASARLIEVPR